MRITLLTVGAFVLAWSFGYLWAWLASWLLDYFRRDRPASRRSLYIGPPPPTPRTAPSTPKTRAAARRKARRARRITS